MNITIITCYSICIAISIIYETHKTKKLNFELEKPIFRHSERWKIIDKTSYFNSESRRNIERLYFSYSQLNKHDIDVQEIHVESSEHESGSVQQMVDIIFKTIYPAVTFFLLAFLTTNNNLLGLAIKNSDTENTSQITGTTSTITKTLLDILGSSNIIIAFSFFALFASICNLYYSNKRKKVIKIHSEVIKKVKNDIYPS